MLHLEVLLLIEERQRTASLVVCVCARAADLTAIVLVLVREFCFWLNQGELVL